MPGWQDALKQIFGALQGMFPDLLLGSMDSILASSHRCAIGLVVVPGNRTLAKKWSRRLFDINSTLNEWGHTAVYVRVEGKITCCLGYDPHRGWMVISAFAGTTKDIESGKIPTSGQIYMEGSLISFSDTFAVEFPLDARSAKALSKRLKVYKAGARGQYLTTYVRSKGPFTSDQKGNCITFIRAVLKDTTGFDIYTTLSSLHGTNYPSISNPTLYDFGGVQSRLTGLARRGELVLYKKKKKRKSERATGQIVQKRTLPRVAHNVSSVYMRQQFGRGLWGVVTSAAGIVVSTVSPSGMGVLRSSSSHVPRVMSTWRDDHFYVAVGYLLLAVRTGFPRAGNSVVWRILYQIVMVVAIVNFVNAVLSGGGEMLWEIGYDAAWVLIGLLVDMLLD